MCGFVQAGEGWSGEGEDRGGGSPDPAAQRGHFVAVIDGSVSMPINI